MASTALERELILGRYRPLRPLGSGGMGHVWLARDEQTGLDVSLKMVAREGKSAERAEREARAAAALRHPRCQRVYALARDTDHVYIAYEYVPGRTLRQALAAGELGDNDAVEAAAQVLEALAHAHGRGIVHRDVKPSNVLLGEADAIDIRLLDFGLAQMDDFETLTAIGDVPGTLTYVSPERLGGETATTAADVWAVGVMLWEALAGQHPFRSDSREATTRRIRAGAPPIEAVRPDLAPRLRAAISSALALDPGERPSAAALAQTLRAPVRAPAARPPDPNRPPILDAAARGRLVHAGDRVLPAATAAIWTGWVTTTLPFYPSGWPLGLTLAAATIGIGVPRLALPFALVVSLLPLANVSLGLAALAGVLAVAWTALAWRDPRAGALLVAGPLLASASALPLLPLVAPAVRNPFRRAAQTFAAVLLAGVVAGIERRPQPFAAAPGHIRLGIAGVKSLTRVATAIVHAAPLVLVEEAAALTAVALVLPLLRGRGVLVAALGGGGLLAVTALLAPRASLLPLVAAAIATGAVLAISPARRGPD
jgi:hypothetical protein